MHEWMSHGRMAGVRRLGFFLARAAGQNNSSRLEWQNHWPFLCKRFVECCMIKGKKVCENSAAVDQFDKFGMRSTYMPL